MGACALRRASTSYWTPANGALAEVPVGSGEPHSVSGRALHTAFVSALQLPPRRLVIRTHGKEQKELSFLLSSLEHFWPVDWKVRGLRGKQREQRFGCGDRSHSFPTRQAWYHCFA